MTFVSQKEGHSAAHCGRARLRPRGLQPQAMVFVPNGSFAGSGATSVLKKPISTLMLTTIIPESLGIVNNRSR